MGRTALLIFVLLALVVYDEAVPVSETHTNKLSEETYKKGSRLLEQLTRERRRIDYYDWEDFLPTRKCTNCNILSIGNGYKNTNIVTFNGPKPKGWSITK